MYRFTLRRAAGVLALGALLLTGCDAALDPEPETASATPAASVGATSAIDGNPILSLSAAEFYGGSKAAIARDLLAARGQPLLDKMQTVLAEANAGTRSSDFVMLKEALDNPSQSSHVQVTLEDGDVEEYIVGVEWLSDRDGRTSNPDATVGNTYVMLDPSRFYEEPEPGAGSLDVTAMPLSGSRSGPATAIFDDGTLNVPSDPNAAFLVVVPIPVRRPRPPCNPPDDGGGGEPDPGCSWSYSGGSSNGGNNNSGGNNNGGGSSGPDLWLALRQLRLNHNYDGDSWVNAKQEVQMSMQPTDDFSREYNKRLDFAWDEAFWTGLPDPGFVPSTMEYVEFTPGIRYWYEVPDVDYAGEDYDFDLILKYVCDYNSFWLCNPGFVTGISDFPLVQLSGSSAYWRGLHVEDDGDVNDFRRREGGPWEGDVETFDFATGGYSTMLTKHEADGCGWLVLCSSDRVFGDSGFRRANLANARNLENSSGDIRAESNDFKYIFSLREETYYTGD